MASLLPLILLDAAASLVCWPRVPSITTPCMTRPCILMSSDSANPPVGAEQLSEPSLVSLHEQHVALRGRLEQDGMHGAVPSDFNYSLATADYYADPAAPHTGKYASVRESLDTSFHVQYSAARQALQDRLLDDALSCQSGEACAPSASPWIVFTAGAMGSGKSRTFEYLCEKGIVPLQNIQILDSDMFKASLPEWRGYLEREPLAAGFHTRRESGYLLEIAQEAALRERRHIWVDGSLRDGEWYAREFARIRADHPAYKIAIVHVVASRKVVMRRVQSRAAVTGRHVPEAEIDDSMRRVPAAVGLLAPLADFLAVVDNSADTPHLVEYCDGGTCYVGARSHAFSRLLAFSPSRLARVRCLPNQPVSAT